MTDWLFRQYCETHSLHYETMQCFITIILVISTAQHHTGKTMWYIAYFAIQEEEHCTEYDQPT